jgi:large subunit ribosomal protein L25
LVAKLAFLNYLQGFIMSKKEYVIHAVSREVLGRGASRRLRRESDSVPAVVYGAGKPVQLITLSHKEIFHQLEHEGFASHLISLKLDGKSSENVLLKDLQVHPYKPKVLHADFLRVRMNEKITVHVPVHFENEAVSPGVKAGGMVNHILAEITVECLPANIPDAITIDLATAELDSIIHLSDITLPKGVVFPDLEAGDDKAVATIHIPRAVVEEEPVAAAEESADAAEGESAEGSAEATDASEDTEDKE